ncbi:hypothetical protein ACTA71_007338 [Dictyostelium dimigraforme]
MFNNIPNQQHHTGPTSNNENLGQQLNQVLILLQTIQSQTKKITSFQNQTYEWNLKHHQNIQNVLKQNNRINSIIDSKQSNKESNENKNLANEESFHQRIMNTYNPLDPFSEELENLIMQIDKRLFNQLREDSLEVIYPFILKWIRENNSLVFSLVLIWESSTKFQQLLNNKKFKEINKKILDCIIKYENKGIISAIISQGDFPFSDEEYNNLKIFLNDSP